MTKGVIVEVSPKQIGLTVSSEASKVGVVLTWMYWLILLSFLQPSGKTDVLVSHIFKLAIYTPGSSNEKVTVCPLIEVPSPISQM